MKGRRPLSNTTKQLRNTYRADRDVSIDVKRTDKTRLAAIRCPGHLTPEAKKEWRRIAPVLYDSGILTDLDRSAFEAYCVWHGIHQIATHEIARDGTTVKTSAGTIKAHPAVKLARDSVQQMRLLGEVFGLNPSARGRVKIVALPVPDTEYDEFSEYD